MSEIETIQISIHLNLLLAKNNVKQKNFELAIQRIQDARRLLEQLEVLFQKNEQKLPSTP